MATTQKTKPHSTTPSNIILFAHHIGLKKPTIAKAGLTGPILMISRANIVRDKIEKRVFVF